MPIATQNWDGVTAPATPANWTFASPITTAATGSAPTPFSAPNVLQLSTATTPFYAATYNTQDGVGGNVVLTGLIILTGNNSSISLLARASAAPISYTTSSFYEARFLGGTFVAGSLNLWYQNAGTSTQIGLTIGSITITSTIWYRMTFTLNGTALSVALQRTTDSFWLTSAGAWQAGAATAISQVDANITGQGYSGYGMKQSSGGFAYADDWSLSQVSTQVGLPNIKIASRPIKGPMFSRVYG